MMEARRPIKSDFNGKRQFTVHKRYSVELPSGDVSPPLPIRITHFMQPFCATYGMPTRKLLFKLQEERPNVFLEFREAVMRQESRNEAEGKSVVEGWSVGLDRDMKDDTFDLNGAVDEMVQTGFEVICPFTKVSAFANGRFRDVLRIIGTDQVNDHELYETLIRSKLDAFSNVQNSERLHDLQEAYKEELQGLIKELERREKNGNKTG